ncbi:MAG: type II secretion system F family protein [Candidatus Omnitrophica bacterium]|nr:type II secretion system F family protein [Candidatus Omnitrophota bacterium]MBU2251131.1 type II secretion system F family protein [Candidatus Omnitrophota bacterium]MBU2265924.1 type II secretion system F family protein [Candidatus Omnitrophota bacterium]MBU2473549.1 type II secretion system F family protein [Candidatus Omnitrophota bacterium]
MTLIIPYLILGIALVIISYYGVTFLLKRWDKAQQRKAEQTASHFEEMFVFLRRKILVRLYIVLPLLLGIVGYFVNRTWWMALIFAVCGAFLPLWLVNILDRRRRKLFVNQLVDGLMIMNSCLKGGLTLVQAFEVLAEEMTAPLSQEISLLNREIKVGVTLEEALLRLNGRMPSEEMTLVSSAIIVARETGGDLTKVFARLIDTIRDRLKLRDLVSTLTIQARLQAIIISLLGPAFFFIVRKIRPDHFDVMWQDEVGRLILLIAVVLQVLGFVLIIVLGKVEI